MERAIASYLANQQVESVDIQLLHGTLRTGQLVWLEQPIAFKGVAVALQGIARGENERATFSARLASEPSVRVRGDYNPARLTCSTATGQLSGTRRQFVLGYVQNVTAEAIEMRPIMIAYALGASSSTDQELAPGRARVPLAWGRRPVFGG